MKRLVVLVLTLFMSFNVLSAPCPTITSNTDAGLKWTDPTERQDNKPLDPSEIKDYQVTLRNHTTDVTCEKEVGRVNTVTIPIEDNTGYDAWIKTRDTDNRLSDLSKLVVIPELDLKKPATVSLQITKIAVGFDYSFNWLPVQTFADGTPLPEGAVSKYYLFRNGQWVRDVQPNAIPFILTLAIGEHTFEVETEILVNGQRVVSDRSTPQIITVIDESIAPPAPPFLEYIVPEGYVIKMQIQPVP